MNDPIPTAEPGTAVQVPRPAELVVAPTPQDRALQRPRPAALVVAPTPQDRALLPVEHPTPDGPSGGTGHGTGDTIGGPP